MISVKEGRADLSNLNDGARNRWNCHELVRLYTPIGHDFHPELSSSNLHPLASRLRSQAVAVNASLRGDMSTSAKFSAENGEDPLRSTLGCNCESLLDMISSALSSHVYYNNRG